MGGCKHAHRQLLKKSWCCILLPHGNFMFQVLSLIIYIHFICKTLLLFSEIIVCKSAEPDQSPSSHVAGITFLSPNHPLIASL